MNVRDVLKVGLEKSYWATVLRVAAAGLLASLALVVPVVVKGASAASNETGEGRGVAVAWAYGAAVVGLVWVATVLSAAVMLEKAEGERESARASVQKSDAKELAELLGTMWTRINGKAIQHDRMFAMAFPAVCLQPPAFVGRIAVGFVVALAFSEE